MSSTQGSPNLQPLDPKVCFRVLLASLFFRGKMQEEGSIDAWEFHPDTPQPLPSFPTCKRQEAQAFRTPGVPHAHLAAMAQQQHGMRRPERKIQHYFERSENVTPPYSPAGAPPQAHEAQAQRGEDVARTPQQTDPGLETSWNQTMSNPGDPEGAPSNRAAQHERERTSESK